MRSPLRHAFIAMSKNPQLQDVIVGVPISRQVARRFVAGEALDDAIAAIRATNAARMLATLDFLGEHVSQESEARANADEYLRALQAIHASGVNANISIKLTAMGLGIDDEFCYQNVRRLAECAAALGNFVRIDMEDSAVTGRTLAIYRRLRGDFANVGVVIQAYLYRSEEDVRSLMQQGMAHLRLCKGAYDEPPAVAFQAKAEVDQSMTRLIRLMLESQAQFPGAYPAVASHDHMIINWTKAYAHHHGIAPDVAEGRRARDLADDRNVRPGRPVQVQQDRQAHADHEPRLDAVEPGDDDRADHRREVGARIGPGAPDRADVHQRQHRNGSPGASGGDSAHGRNDRHAAAMLARAFGVPVLRTSAPLEPRAAREPAPSTLSSDCGLRSRAGTLALI